MSAFTEPSSPAPPDRPAPPGIFHAAWRPAGIIYLIVVLAALGAGLWSEAVWPSFLPARPAPLPALQTLAVGQVAFILLIYPLVILHRAGRGETGRYWAEVIIESCVYMLVTVPFYLAAAYLADAVAADVIRAAAYAAGIWSLAWSAGWWLVRRPKSRPVVMLVLLLAALALPAGYYIAREFLTAGPAHWLRRLAPATFAWEAAASRPSVSPAGPLWPWLIWPGVALVAVLVNLLLKPAAKTKGAAPGH